MTPPGPGPRVLIVDDEPSFSSFVAEALSDAGFAVVVADRPSQALARFGDGVYDVAVLDLNLPEMGGIELARRIREQSPDTQLVVLTGHPDMESAIAGVKEGIFDYLQKGALKVARLEKSVREAAERRRLALENRELLAQLSESNRLLSKLHEMTAALAGERFLDRVMARVVESARALLRAQRSRLLLFQTTAGGDLMVERAAGDSADTLPGVRLNPQESIAATVAQHEQPLLLESAASHPAYASRVDGLPATLPGFLCAPVRHDTVLGALIVAGIGEARLEHGELLATLARQAGVAIQNALHQDRAVNFFTHTSELLVSLLEKVDPLYAGHSRGTALLSDMLTRRLGLSGADRRGIHFGALLHDIGKMRLPPELLQSDAPLSDEQRAMLRRHPALGLEMLKPISLWQDVLPIVHAHHERWDGSGYPLGLKGDEIPLGARVVAVAEAYDAMTRGPHAAPALDEGDALAELERCAGSQFEPQLVRLFAAEIRQQGDPRRGGD